MIDKRVINAIQNYINDKLKQNFLKLEPFKQCNDFPAK